MPYARAVASSATDPRRPEHRPRGIDMSQISYQLNERFDRLAEQLVSIRGFL